ncbi:Abi family protein [Streptococcus sp. zg-86]|uniref:Abi family protein n=2 Tax=Streptococcus TaxID=1301 RepID=A0A6I4RF36_9STRE|nr:Abi family protein [Streptococcus sp. zg-86]MTB90558.1 Abi family protein [Streptococcus sp. zg-36]MWV56104.1 Abi family protein [Streptococcus sp. zg-70]QTH48707.1 Abi family protein [Streptococcus sp. zg-86]
MNSKPKLSFEGLLGKFAEKKIDFGSYSKDEIIAYLRERSYYYKISSYRKNFPKLPQNKGYDKLTFDHLVVSANLDVRLREYLMNLTLDIEHATRTRLMTIMTDMNEIEGYEIVEDFQDEYPERFAEILERFRHNDYKKDMFEKRTQISVWVLMEIIDYGTLIQFLQFFSTKYPNPPEKLYTPHHKFIKNIRNSCAHNDVFLINIFDQSYNVPRPAAAIKSFASEMNILPALVRYRKIIDIVVLFYIHKKICSDNLNGRRYREGRLIIEKYQENNILLSHSTSIAKLFQSVLSKCVDFLQKS